MPKIQRLNEDVSSSAAAALHMASKKASHPFAVAYNLPNGPLFQLPSDQKSYISDTVSKRGSVFRQKISNDVEGAAKYDAN